MRAALVAIALVIVAACSGSSSSDGTTPPSDSTSVVTFGGAPGAAQQAACAENVRALQQASDIYAASHGGPAPSLQSLMQEEGISRTPNVNDGYVLTYDSATGHVGATGACTA